MWRSIIVSDGEKLSTRENWLIIDMPDKTQKRVPLSDIYSIVVDNRSVMITVPLISRLAEHQIHLVITDEKHLPVSVTLPLNTHYRCYKVLKNQMKLSHQYKGETWRRIISAKIENQASVLKKHYVEDAVIHRMRELAQEVIAHDSGNREGIAAKMFFRHLYGANFVRFSDDKINACLNYGYAILRSSITKTFIAYGFNCVLGIHHISETNAFNLSDDFMEPFRAIVDDWVCSNPDSVETGLLKPTKAGLINLLNENIIFDGKVTKLRYAFDLMVRSWVSSIEQNNPERLILPRIIEERK